MRIMRIMRVVENISSLIPRNPRVTSETGHESAHNHSVAAPTCLLSRELWPRVDVSPHGLRRGGTRFRRGDRSRRHSPFVECGEPGAGGKALQHHLHHLPRESHPGRIAALLASILEGAIQEWRRPPQPLQNDQPGSRPDARLDVSYPGAALRCHSLYS